MAPQTWKIGELAKLTGLSIRTLHYYEEIGLLAASERTEGGHRVYTAADLTRLQRILSLRQLDFPLEDIQACLDRPEFALEPLVALHLERVTQELALKQRIHQRLRALHGRLQAGDAVPVPQIIEAMEAITMLENHLTPDQVEAVRATHERPDAEAIKGRWQALIGAVRAHLEAGDDPTAPPMLAHAQAWRELVDLSTGGDEALARNIKTMYDEQPQARARVGIDDALWAYAKRALAVNPGPRGW